MVAASAGVVARDRGRDAEAGLDAATKAAAAARHEAVAARSLALRSTDLSAAALLAIYAWQEDPDMSAESALVGSLTSASGFLGRSRLPGSFAAVGVLPDEDQLLLAEGTTVRLLNPKTGELGVPFARSLNYAEVNSVLRVSGDGTRAVQLINTHIQTKCPPNCPVIVVYDVRARQVLGPPIEVGFDATDIAVSADGRLVSATGGGRRGGVATWDTSTGKRLSHARSGGTALTYGLGDQLFLASPSGPMRELSAPTLSVRGRIAVPPGSADHQVLFVRGLLVAAGERGQLVHDLERHRRSWSSATHGCETLAVSTEQPRVFCGTSAGTIEERDLGTGQLTGRLLDPQFGALTDLVVYAQRDGTEALVGFQKDGYQYARWRVDGPGVGARLLARGAVATGGYDPSDRMVLATRQHRTEVLDATTGSLVLTLPGTRHAVWLSPTTIGVIASRPLLVDVPSGRVTRPRLDDVVGLFPDRAGTHAWAVSRKGNTTRLRRFSLDGRLAQPGIVLEGVEGVRVAANTGQVLVTYRRSGIQGYLADWETHEYDAVTGEHITLGLFHSSQVIAAPDGSLLVANEQGQVETFPDIFGADVGSFPRAQAAVSSLQPSVDQRRLLVTSVDQAVQLIDWRTRSRLGDPIDTESPIDVPGGWLRHDGIALVTNSSMGIIEWDLRPEAMARALCQLAGRNFETHEWNSYIGSDVPERILCPGFQ